MSHNLKWAKQGVNSGGVKSLLQIQAEERELKKVGSVSVTVLIVSVYFIFVTGAKKGGQR